MQNKQSQKGNSYYYILLAIMATYFLGHLLYAVVLLMMK